MYIFIQSGKNSITLVIFIKINSIARNSFLFADFSFREFSTESFHGISMLHTRLLVHFVVLLYKQGESIWGFRFGSLCACTVPIPRSSVRVISMFSFTINNQL